MSNVPGQYTPDEINHVFANLQPQDVEQFYIVYQQWLRQRKIANLHARIETLRNQIAENDLRIQQVQPSSIALSTLARLQSNGVTDLDLLDRMLARGEAWLDSTMQHLDYCEQFDFIRGNYTEWCEHALEGAYDWIDSMQELDVAHAVNNDKISTTSSAGSTLSPQSGELLNEATEEIFLQKLMSEEDVSFLDTAQEIDVVSSTAQEEALATPTPLEDQDTAHIQTTGPHAAQSVSEHSIETHSPQEVPASSSVDATDPTQVPIDEASSMASDSASISHTPVEETSALVETISSDTVGTAETSATLHPPLEQAATTESKEVDHEAVVAETSSDEVVVSPSTPALEEATAPLIPSVTHLKRISDTPTIPEIPAAQASPSTNIEPAAEQFHTIDDTPWQPPPPAPEETSPSGQKAGQEGTQQASAPPSPSPAAQSPRKRNFLLRLFSIFFRRKTGK